MDDDVQRASRALKAMNAAMKAEDWWTAVRNGRVWVRWFDSVRGTDHPSAEVHHQLLAALIVKYRQNRRWWQWPWP